MTRTKWKIILQNINLIDLPTRQNRMFLKIKNCVSNVITKSYHIKNNQCEFIDPVEIEVNFPSDILKAINKNSKSLKIKPLRLSFRLENSSRMGFQRYGIVMVDLLKLILNNGEQIANQSNVRSLRTGLENCSEKPILSINFIFPSGFIPKNVILEPSLIQVKNDVSISPNSTSTSKSNATNNSSSQYSSPKCSQSSQNNQNTVNLFSFPALEKNSISTSNSNSNLNKISSKVKSCPIPNNSISSLSIPTLSISNPTNYNSISPRNSNISDHAKPLVNLPIKMTKQRYDELEGEIDNLLAGIINDESIQ